MSLVSMDFLPEARGLAASMQSFVQTIFFALCSAVIVPIIQGNGAYYDLAIMGFGLTTIALWTITMSLRLEHKAHGGH